MPRITLFALLALAACHDDRPHVFQTPPPRVAAPAAAAQAAAAESEFGSRGADARVQAVVAQATGMPVTLSQVTGTFQVLTVVARGPHGWYPDRRARVELLFRGPKTMRYERKLEEPAPTLIAHNFVVPTIHDAADGLPAGNYWMSVRLIMRDTTPIAESLPMLIAVR